VIDAMFSDNRKPDPVLVALRVEPDPDLAARNAARIEQAKAKLGDKYICAAPILTPKDLKK
jgi:hypothetical protein